MSAPYEPVRTAADVNALDPAENIEGYFDGRPGGSAPDPGAAESNGSSSLPTNAMGWM